MASPCMLLLVSYMVPSIRAFRPRLESLPHYSHAYRDLYSSTDTRRCDLYCSSSQLYMTEPSHHDRDDADSIGNSDFDFVPASYDSLVDDFSLLFDGVTFPLLQEQADVLAFETFEENKNSIEFEAWDNCGEDCKECYIPKGWHTSAEEIDVMAFLGVTRVKPLIVSTSTVTKRIT